MPENDDQFDWSIEDFEEYDWGPIPEMNWDHSTVVTPGQAIARQGVSGTQVIGRLLDCPENTNEPTFAVKLIDGNNVVWGYKYSVSPDPLKAGPFFLHRSSVQEFPYLDTLMDPDFQRAPAYLAAEVQSIWTEHF